VKLLPGSIFAGNGHAVEVEESRCSKDDSITTGIKDLINKYNNQILKRSIRRLKDTSIFIEEKQEDLHF